MPEQPSSTEFSTYAIPRILVAIIIVGTVLWGLDRLIDYDATHGPFTLSWLEPHQQADQSEPPSTAHSTFASTATGPLAPSAAKQDFENSHIPATDLPSTAEKHPPADQQADLADHLSASQREDEPPTSDSLFSALRKASTAQDRPAPQSPPVTAHQSSGAHPSQPDRPLPGPIPTTTHTTAPPAATHRPGARPAATATPHAPVADLTAHAPTTVPGVAFIQATIQPLQYELDQRWWGWRPNDVLDVTDNITNYQMGLLEVTRRTAVALAERLSRTGTTAAFDKNLEQAMNWFMVKSTSYWFPSAESKYREGLQELEIYLEKLKEGKASFYTRTDNLIPLLSAFEELLGSCDENLVKHHNKDGSAVSFFEVDDHFFYTRGVTSAMATVLKAVHHDFINTLESRNGTELLHHAIVSCEKAAALDPWIILDRDLSSIFANHRANMAAPVSHARFYIGQLIKTLST